MKRLSIILVILWMIVIFYFSSANGSVSTAQSDIVTNSIINIFHYNGDITNLIYIVRKLFHVFEYFVLGILTYNAYKYHGRKIIIPIMICFIYAITDELHQVYISGRNGNIYDVLLDTLASTLAIIIRK